MYKIILIGGKARHGKDTSANILKEKLEDKGNRVLIMHFADLIKFYCKTYFGWDGKKDEEGRTLLQVVGTEKGRSKRPNYWVEQIAEFLDVFGDAYEYIIIPDFRFRNEYDFFERNGFDVVSLQIVRPNFNNGLTEEQKNHLSETALDHFRFDSVINNHLGISELTWKLYRFLEDYTTNKLEYYY
jgi:hypothetical protein